MSERSAAVPETNKASGPAPGPDDGAIPNSHSLTSDSQKHSSVIVANSVTTSAANSPKPSREPSPTRPTLRSSGSSSSRGLRSRTNSQDVVSPSRRPSISGTGGPSMPSAAAVQRALSVANSPHLQPTTTSEPSIRAPRPQHSASSTPGDNTPHWPASPRLKSPPNASSTRHALSLSRTADAGVQPPSIHVQRPNPPTHSTTQIEGKSSIRDGEWDNQPAPVSTHKPSRGTSAAGTTLETVQESSLPATPATDTTNSGQHIQSLVSGPSAEKTTDKRVGGQTQNGVSTVTESGSESGGNKSDGKDLSKQVASNNAPRVTSMPPLKSFASTLNRTRSKPTKEGSKQNMTVETETVSSVPQVAVGGGAGDRGQPGRTDTGGSLRLKLSTETIRPRKDKKKTVRKAPSISSGTASSKADIFEARVASAVDEANSSDSEETFVYESNPPDPHPPRSDRYHSRTPSATSMKSQLGQRSSIRSVHNLVEGAHTVAGKRSMKFTNNFHSSSGVDSDPGLRVDGTVRKGHLSGTHGTSSNGSHHHIGHYGRGGGGHTSPFDNNSPFLQASKPLRSSVGNAPRLPSAPPSPRSPHYLRLPGANGKKSDEVFSYDVEADDERTPLIGSVRTNRSRQSRRPNSATIRQMKLHQQRQQGWFIRYACCAALTILVVFFFLGAVAFLFATTKPLLDVDVREIQNVLASEQAIMLDLLVEAVNPNVIAVAVNDMDVNIFAKSKHVGSDRISRDYQALEQDHAKTRHASDPRFTGLRTASQNDPHFLLPGVDEGNDPIPDPEGDKSQTMLLGRIFEFDSALSFDGSPFKRQPSTSVGELRLAKPGNKTEQGGSQRWERVIQHKFELIVRGVLKYQLPLSSRLRTAPIGASIIVHAEEGANAMGEMRLERAKHDYRPGSNALTKGNRRRNGS